MKDFLNSGGGLNPEFRPNPAQSLSRIAVLEPDQIAAGQGSLGPPQPDQFAIALVVRGDVRRRRQLPAERDIARTSVNVPGNCLASAVVARPGADLNAPEKLEAAG